MIFPAVFDWAQFSDFQVGDDRRGIKKQFRPWFQLITIFNCQTQLLDKVRMKLGQVPMDTEETNKTADSTFKPKSLRNRAKEKADALVAAEREREEAEERKRRREGEKSGAVNMLNLLRMLG